MANNGIVKKTELIPFLDIAGPDGPKDYKRIKKSTTFPLSLNPEVKTFEFISTDFPEEELDRYKPSLGQDLTMFKGEPDFETVFDHVFELKTGKDAHRNVLIVFYMESGTETAETARTVYKAWEVDAILKINTLDGPASTITFDLALNSPVVGAVAMTGAGEDLKPEFLKGKWTDGTFTADVV